MGWWARARPSLCIRHPNNYPSCSSSTSPSQSSFTADWLDSHSHLGTHSWGSLLPTRDKLLLEKNLKQLMCLENRGVRSGAMAKGGWDGPQTRAQG